VNRTTQILLINATAAAMGSSVASTVLANPGERTHAVFVMTNDADTNEVWAYERTDYGTLRPTRHYRTEGRGSGGKVDPLASQGSLTLSQDRNWLLAVNAGSGTVSLFAVDGERLDWTDKAPTGGSEPNAVAEHDGLVYILNTAGSSSVVGFRVHNGRLVRIADSLRFLSGNGTGAASLAFSPDGNYLLVTERATNDIDVFKVLTNGLLAPIKVNPSAGTGAFSLTFAPNGTAVVSEIGPSGTNASTVSSYKVNADLTLNPVSIAVPTLGAANCWNVVTPNGRFVYVSNSGSSSIAGFLIGNSGTLTPIAGTVVANNPASSTNIDLAISSDGNYLYSLNGAAGSIGMFAIRPTDGTLTNLGALGGLPASAGLNGIAAN
jgi:6-phosphogluconolactonase